MLGGQKHKQPLGYTIIEVMIVLAVSGVMFLIASGFINGKQEKASFMQGTNELVSQVQNTIEQVTDGQFSDVPVNCSYAGKVTTISSGAKAQGTNSTCTFLGKLLNFPASGGNYRVISLAGGRVDPAVGAPSLAQADPGFVDPVAVHSDSATLTTTQTIPQNLQIVSVSLKNAAGVTVSPPATYNNFGFLQGLGSSDGGSFQSGAQTISLVYSPVNLSDISTDDKAVNNKLAYAKSAVICLTDGTRYARLLVGGGSTSNNASQLNVTLQVVTVCT